MNKKRIYLLSGFILVAAFSRIIPHPYNFAPIGAMSIFGAAYFSDKRLSLMLPLVAMFISDLLVNNILYASFYEGFVWVSPGFWSVYGAIALIVLAGWFILKKVNTKTVIAGSLSASIIFFLVTNFGVWLSSPTYPLTFGGLMTSYTMAIPFFHFTVLGDLFYSGVLFGAFEFVKSRNTVFQQG
ncbi:MAG: hypothetical protein FH748_03965 [Balneolaceae bacterium]|nr:hypothetical protein [Balneolaceae bacterium]